MWTRILTPIPSYGHWKIPPSQFVDTKQYPCYSVNGIYRLQYKYPYKPFSEDERKQVKASTYMYTEDYEFIRWVHAYETGSNLRLGFEKCWCITKSI